MDFKLKNYLFYLLLLIVATSHAQVRSRINFNRDWVFNLGEIKDAEKENFNDANWRKLNLPHDWGIENSFDEKSPAGVGGGALSGGLGWYRKIFSLSEINRGKLTSIEFDGVYRNSEVFINGHLLGKRPNGFISFNYDLTPYLNYGNKLNTIAVKVDNSEQPNSRWYSGSGIFRNVWLVTVNPTHVTHWGTFVTTSKTILDNYLIEINAKINYESNVQNQKVKTCILDENNKLVATKTNNVPFLFFPIEGKPRLLKIDSLNFYPPNMKLTPFYMDATSITLKKPHLWSIEDPYLYKAVTKIFEKGVLVDEYTTPFGIRSFKFDINKGFSLNGKSMKINGVCLHHDLGCLGTTVNKRAIQRQLEILKGMGCNAIRTSHNPPAPELLDLCDEMGFIVMDEAFDMWEKEKNKYDYHLDFVQWHKKDLEDQILRDRNHPSVFMWSIGNEVNEQWSKNDTSGTQICKELVDIVQSLDRTRYTVSALSNPKPFNPLVKANALDLIGFNYEHKLYASFHDSFPGQKFIATETVSALETRGYYDAIPSDSVRRWPLAWDKPFTTGNIDNTVSAYDNVSTPWGSTHEETWKLIKKSPYLSGQYIWTGFDFIGEPTPYGWPSRSSYFGIVDLAGFPKDAYYMYQSEWTNKPVLHLLPHWNWRPGQTIDIWAYYSQADKVELFLNGKSLGVKKKIGDDLHVMWRVVYEAGELKAVSRKNGKLVLSTIIKTAGKAAEIILEADRKIINANAEDLSFVTIKIVDKNGTVLPNTDNDISFKVAGEGTLAGVDNGDPTSHLSFKGNHILAFHGLCLAVLKANAIKGSVKLTASSPSLPPTSITIETK